MKRLNRKGFTLIELMAVIAILVIIMGIALPNITSSIERSKNKEKETKIKLAESAGELYFDRHSDNINTNGVALKKLIEENFLTSIEIEGICDYSDGPGYCCVYYDTNSGKYTFQPDGDKCYNMEAYGME